MSTSSPVSHPAPDSTKGPAPGAHPGPQRILEALSAHELTAAIHTAIDLDLFTAIGEGVDHAAGLASRLPASPRGTRILCDYLTIHGFLTKEDDHYALTPESAMFLDRRSPACLASMSEFLGHDQLLDSFRDLTGIVRRGGPRSGEESTRTENPIWVAFAHGMAPLQFPAANFMAELTGMASGSQCRILDVAAGHGVFGIVMAQRNPQARVVALDWAPVLEVATENARRAGVADRFETIAGSAFEAEFGRDYDLVLMTNFLHHFDPATNETLLRRAHAALKPGGRVVTLEFVPNDDRVSPDWAAAFSLVMLTSTAQGDAYTFAELERMFRNAGFARTTRHAMPGMPSTVLVSES